MSYRPSLLPLRLRRRFVELVAAILFVAAISDRRSYAATVPQRDPQAITLASQAVKALAGTTVLSDATLQGAANFTAGGDQESGSFTLELKGNEESKLVLALSGGQRQEIRNAQAGPDSHVRIGAGAPQGAWSGADGVKHSMALHNCWTDASTLLPVFTLEAALANPQVSASYLGQAVPPGGGVLADHLRLSYVLPGQTASMTAEIQGLSMMDVYLDAASHLPVALAFKTHPDNDLGVSIPVEILFSGYQKLDGIQAPTRVEKLLQGTLTLDLAVRSVAINTGISDSEFSTQ